MGITENLKRGTIELMILTLLKHADMYGYQLVQELSVRSDGDFVMPEGTLYPAMYRLMDNGYVSDRKELVGKRRTRVYYHIEQSGENYLNELILEYLKVSNGIQKIFDSFEGETNEQ